MSNYTLELWHDDAKAWYTPSEEMNWRIVGAGGPDPVVYVDEEPLETPWRIMRRGMVVVKSKVQVEGLALRLA